MVLARWARGSRAGRRNPASIHMKFLKPHPCFSHAGRLFSSTVTISPLQQSPCLTDSGTCCTSIKQVAWQREFREARHKDQAPEATTKPLKTMEVNCPTASQCSEIEKSGLFARPRQGSTPGSPTPHAEPKQVLTLYYYTGLYFYILLPVGRFSLRGFPTWRLQSCSAHFLASAVK